MLDCCLREDPGAGLFGDWIEIARTKIKDSTDSNRLKFGEVIFSSFCAGSNAVPGNPGRSRPSTRKIHHSLSLTTRRWKAVIRSLPKNDYLWQLSQMCLRWRTSQAYPPPPTTLQSCPAKAVRPSGLQVKEFLRNLRNLRNAQAKVRGSFNSRQRVSECWFHIRVIFQIVSTEDYDPNKWMNMNNHKYIDTQIAK